MQQSQKARRIQDWVYKLTIALMILLPLVSLGYLLLVDLTNQTYQAESSKNLQIAKLTGDFIDDFIYDIKKSLYNAAGVGENAEYNMQHVLNDLRLSHPEVAEFFLTDAKGNILLAVPPAKQTGINVSDMEYFQASMAGRSYAGGPFTGRIAGFPTMMISVPYYRGNKVAGIVAASVPLSEVRQEIAGINLGPVGYAMLISKEGKLIAHPDIENIEEFADPAKNPAFNTLRQGGSGSLNTVTPYDRKPALISYFPLQQADWLMVTIQPLTAFQHQLLLTLTRNILVLLLVILFVGLAYRYLSLYKDRLNLEKVQKSEKLALVGQLAAGLAHEIRNPLTSVKGFVQLIQAKKGQETPAFYLDIILEELNRIDQIVSEMVLLAKPAPLRLSTVNVSHLAQEVVNLLQPQALMQEVFMELNAAPDLVEIEGEANQLKQVFINLMKNSIESMPGGGKVTISLTNHSSKPGVVITVSDTGCGIPSENLNKLGSPFFSTKEFGTGLGLMVTYRIIQNHHGEVTVTSSCSKGTTFTLTLPLQQYKPLL